MKDPVSKFVRYHDVLLFRNLWPKRWSPDLDINRIMVVSSPWTFQVMSWDKLWPPGHFISVDILTRYTHRDRGSSQVSLITPWVCIQLVYLPIRTSHLYNKVLLRRLVLRTYDFTLRFFRKLFYLVFEWNSTLSKYFNRLYTTFSFSHINPTSSFISIFKLILTPSLFHQPLSSEPLPF